MLDPSRSLRLDQQTRSLVFGLFTIKLTPIQFDIVKLLVETKEKIVRDSVFAYHFQQSGFWSPLEKHILELRIKLEPIGIHIRRVVKCGYMLFTEQLIY